MTLEEELFTVSSNIHNHKNRTSLKGRVFFSPFLQTSAFLINRPVPNRSSFLVNTFSLTDRGGRGGWKGGVGKTKDEGKTTVLNPIFKNSPFTNAYVAFASVCSICGSELDTTERLHLRKLVFYFWKETNYKALPLGEKSPS